VETASLEGQQFGTVLFGEAHDVVYAEGDGGIVAFDFLAPRVSWQIRPSLAKKPLEGPKASLNLGRETIEAAGRLGELDATFFVSETTPLRVQVMFDGYEADGELLRLSQHACAVVKGRVLRSLILEF